MFSSLSVVPHWFWFGKEVSRQPHSAAHTLQRRQELDWHGSLRLHQCTPGDRAEVTNGNECCIQLFTIIDQKWFKDTSGMIDLGVPRCVLCFVFKFVFYGYGVVAFSPVVLFSGFPYDWLAVRLCSVLLNNAASSFSTPVFCPPGH